MRSILLRGFDQQVAEKLGDVMKDLGVKFVRPAIPTKIEKVSNTYVSYFQENKKKQDFIWGKQLLASYARTLFGTSMIRSCVLRAGLPAPFRAGLACGFAAHTNDVLS